MAPKSRRMIATTDAPPAVGSSSNAKDARGSSSKNKRKGAGKKRALDQDTAARRPRVLAEGQRGEEAGAAAVTISSEPRLRESGWTDFGLATANAAHEPHIDDDFAMERANIGSYTSDEWEEDNANSDTDGDHTDSSDDDDPKSQVDRLIEKGTLMYMDAENSALSSEDESDDDDDSDFDDSESDITDVSPLVSAAASPLGMSPVLPRRYFSTSPLALHDNREINCGFLRDTENPFNWDNLNGATTHEAAEDEEATYPPVEPQCDNRDKDAINMDLLLQAVMELESRNKINLNHQKSSGLPNQLNDPVFIDPIRDNPHTSHLRRNYLRRKNMSFSNEEVRKIDRENKILLKKIMAAHNRSHTGTPNPPHHHTPHHRHHKSSNSSVNRKKDEDKIRRENLILLRKIQEARPSRDLSSSGSSFASHQICSPSSRSLRSPTGSCGASMRSISQSPHVNVSTARKETAL